MIFKSKRIRINDNRQTIRQQKKEQRHKINTLLKFIFVVLISTFYYSIKSINNTVKQMFKLLPKILQTILIYVLLALSIIGIYCLCNISTNTNTSVETIEQEAIVKEIEQPQIEEQPIEQTEEEEETQTIEQEETNQIEETIEEQIAIDTNTDYSFDDDNAKNVFDEAIAQGLDVDEALIAVSISKHETGSWTSSAFLNGFNFGGIMANGGKSVKRYNSYDEGLINFIEILSKNYFALGLSSISAIGAKYAPINAGNDPGNLNRYWVSSVTKFYNQYAAQ